VRFEETSEKLYPITVDRMLDARTEARLADAGVLLLQEELAEAQVKELSKRTRLNPNKVSKLASRALSWTLESSVNSFSQRLLPQ